MSNDLPGWISAHLSRRLEGVSRKELSRRAFAISDAYRAGGDSSRIDQTLDAVAYAAARMPATYAAVGAALSHAAEMVPAFAPASLLDIGAGPGTATWASREVWPSVRHAQLLDRNQRLLDYARELAACAPQNDTLFDFVAASFSQALDEKLKSDLVVASYALTELPLALSLASLSTLWQLSGEMLIIIEPGTPEGFERMLAYRNALIEVGGHIVAPCTHHAVCPLANAQRWCHFSQRLARSRTHLALKAATVPYEDERFCYLAVSRAPIPLPRTRRILATPKVSKAHVSLTLCAPEIVEEKLVPRKASEAYRIARRADWGDAIEI